MLLAAPKNTSKNVNTLSYLWLPSRQIVQTFSYFWAAAALGGRGTDLAQAGAQAAKQGPGPSRARVQAGPGPKPGLGPGLELFRLCLVFDFIK